MPNQFYEQRDPAENRVQAQRFRKLLKKLFQPELLKVGFRVGPSRWRRRVGRALQVVETQAWKYGGGLCVNLGIHFDFLPSPYGPPGGLEEFEEVHCAIRRRLAPADHKGDFWWRYGEEADDSLACVEHLCSTFRSAALPWLDQVGQYPGLYPELTPSDSALLFCETLSPGAAGAWELVTTVRQATTLDSA